MKMYLQSEVIEVHHFEAPYHKEIRQPNQKIMKMYLQIEVIEVHNFKAPTIRKLGNLTKKSRKCTSKVR